KIVIVGDGSVGKSSVRNVYVHKRFSANYKATIGADFTTKLQPVDVLLQLVDTAGQERFKSLGPAFYRGADACVLVFDLANALSFDSLKGWVESFIKHRGLDHGDPFSYFPFVVLGNKADLDFVAVPASKIAAFISSVSSDAFAPDIPRYYQVSAKMNSNIETAFQAVA
ncbi:ras-domain-containing protein, partial [Ramicandelaber brevisporus]